LPRLLWDTHRNYQSFGINTAPHVSADVPFCRLPFAATPSGKSAAELLLLLAAVTPEVTAIHTLCGAIIVVGDVVMLFAFAALPAGRGAQEELGHCEEHICGCFISVVETLDSEMVYNVVCVCVL
jgi:hypothetical protein